MSFKGDQRNQHFISQAEQRLNALNPDVQKDNQRIYSFTVQDREAHSISLDSERGSKIEATLSLGDLFSFDVLNKKDRLNFERSFGVYEDNITNNTHSFLEKMEAAGSDLTCNALGLFRLKFLNIIRNPYSVKMILNTFEGIRNSVPTTPDHLANLSRVLNGKKPQQTQRCLELGITDQEYKNWLGTIFMMLCVEDSGINFMDSFINELFEGTSKTSTIGVYSYTNEHCLLSDRGGLIEHNDQSIIFNFNLSSSSFIKYVFLDIEKSMRGRFPHDVIERGKTMFSNTPVYVFRDDLQALEVYNKLAVYQSHRNVFCSTDNPYGISLKAL